MSIKFKLILLALVLIFIFSICGCSSADKNYGVSSVTESVVEEVEFENVEDTKIMSSDRVMSDYFDISLFDEENYSDVFLGKKFKIEPIVDNKTFSVPAKLSDVESWGLTLTKGNTYDANSLVFSFETVDLYFENENGMIVSAQVYNSSNSSKKLSECNIVKFKIENNFYSNPNKCITFDVNGITNSLAILDIINILGVPSHFYKVSDSAYYLDYFVSIDDRRNGITVYINPIDDIITAIEFSYYK